MILLEQAWQYALIGFMTSFLFLVLWFCAMLVIALIAKILAGEEN